MSLMSQYLANLDGSCTYVLLIEVHSWIRRVLLEHEKQKSQHKEKLMSDAGSTLK